MYLLIQSYYVVMLTKDDICRIIITFLLFLQNLAIITLHAVLPLLCCKKQSPFVKLKYFLLKINDISTF